MAARGKTGRSRGFKVTISPKRPDRKFKKVIKAFGDELKIVSKKIETNGLKIIRDATPSRTGATRAAWVSRRDFRSDGGFVINFDNPTAAAHFQNVGTAASTGAYIPALDVRIFQGIHPGSTMNVRYLDRAAKDVQGMAAGKLGKLTKFLKVSINRHLKGRRGR